MFAEHLVQVQAMCLSVNRGGISDTDIKVRIIWFELCSIGRTLSRVVLVRLRLVFRHSLSTLLR